MKYFKPELYLAFNEDPTTDLDAAEEEWESNCTKYWQRLEAIRSNFPVDAQTLSFSSFHDAEVMELEINSHTTTFTIKLYGQETKIIWTYTGTTTVETINKWPFAKTKHPDWLYDEWDMDEQSFEHRIMLSDGKILNIRFSDLKIYSSEG